MTSIYEILRRLGIGTRFMGHVIIATAVPLAVADETRLYPEEAATLQCPLSCIERNICTAIEHAWKINPEYMIELVGYELVQPPNVKQFLDILVTFLLHEQEGTSVG